MTAASGAKICSEYIAVTLHKRLANANDEYLPESPAMEELRAECNPIGFGSNSIILVSLEQLVELHMNDLQVHSSKHMLSYTFVSQGSGIPGSSALLGQLVQAGAFASSPSLRTLCLTESQHEAKATLDQWQRQNLVQCAGADESEVTLWKVAEKGMRDLRHNIALAKPAPFPKLRPSLALEDRTPYELQLMMGHAGWICKKRKPGYKPPPSSRFQHR